MQNRSKKRWLDVQIILASLAVTSSVGLWNLFAKGNLPVVNPAGAQPPDPAFVFTYIPNPTATATLDPSAPLHLPVVHLLMGGKLPVAPVVVAWSSGGDSSNQDVGSIGGGGGKSNPPPPAANTGSSKP